ncbi:alpha/beta fold hydrolase [Pseudomonas matsuisoli]|uniref:AB hydrolase-1 domain-containing protein n=1 Tax=Pseudomonas matsuisoli TaxID=1515666 RepID=A0A917UYX9_9PSED|nr:alpha/beta hydrolase [Pseudomonas matsuisoli]GGJ98336.1 hypothetical protein GCM10009304_25320 [Pseudomonas matsuisoli]
MNLAQNALATLALSTLATVACAQEASSDCPSVDIGKCFTDLSTGIRMAYVETGPKDGPALILLHGLTGSARSWADTMAAIQQKDPSLHVIAVDQRGHGAASMPDPNVCAADPKACFTPKHFADDLIAFMDAKGLEKAAVAGSSMGSLIAQELALTHPERVTATILLGSTAASKDNPILSYYLLDDPVHGAWAEGLQAKGITSPEAIYNATPQDADPNIQTWLSEVWVVSLFADPALLQAVSNETAQVKMGTWIGATEALLAYDNSGHLGDLKVPTLALWGTQDTVFPLKPDQEMLQEALASARGQGTPTYWKQYGVEPLPDNGLQVGDFGHNLQWEAPVPLADDIVAFLKTGEPTRDAVRIGKGSKVEVTPDAAMIVGGK